MFNTRKRRSAERFAADIQVHLTLPGGKEEVLLSHDWSPRSVFLRTLTPVPVGAHVRLSLLVGNPHERIFLDGVVSRAHGHNDPAAHGHPGIVVMLNETPAKLLRELEAKARSARIEILPTLEPGPAVFVVGEDHPMRQELVRVLIDEGYAVEEVDNPLGAALAFKKGARPRALVVLEDSGETLAAMKETLPDDSMLEAVITLGEAPQHLGGGLGAPLIVLPRMWPAASIPALLQQFLREQAKTREAAG